MKKQFKISYDTDLFSGGFSSGSFTIEGDSLETVTENAFDWACQAYRDFDDDNITWHNNLKNLSVSSVIEVFENVRDNTNYLISSGK